MKPIRCFNSYCPEIMEILEENLIIRTVSAVFYYANILPETKFCSIYCNDINTRLIFDVLLNRVNNRYLFLKDIEKEAVPYFFNL